MKEEDFQNFLEDFVDFLNGLEASVTKMKHQIAKLVGVAQPTRMWLWDPAKIKWEAAQGSSGEYERTEDVNSLDYRMMVKDLASRGGKLTRDGLFYWVFKNGATVGRKKAKYTKKEKT